MILMADTTPLDGGFVLHEGGGIPNDSLYQIVIRTPRNRQGSLNFGNLRARRKRSGRAMIEDDGRRGKKGVWKGGENELQKIVLVKYDDLHLSRYKEILWPSSRGFLFLPFLSLFGLNYFSTHDQRSIPRSNLSMRRFFFFNPSVLPLLFFFFFLSFFFFFLIYFPILIAFSSNGLSPSLLLSLSLSGDISPCNERRKRSRILAEERRFQFPSGNCNL